MKKRLSILIVAAFVLLLANGLNTPAQVKKVQMHIAGYLCGN
jgi:hypothetical protein